MQAIQTALNFKPKHVVPPLNWVGHIPFAATLVSEIKPNLIVELGTHTGNSYFTLCQAVQENKLPTRCYAVDTWKGECHAGHYDETIYNEVNKYNQENHSDFSYLLRTTFDEAAKQFSDNSIDLLHIDGLHTYEAVKNDYETWLPKVKEGGVILFHDICCRHADFGVWKLWDEINASQKFTHSYQHSYGLGILIKTDLQPNNEFLSTLTNPASDINSIDIFQKQGNTIIQKATLNQLEEVIIKRDGAIAALKAEALMRDSIITSLHDEAQERESQITQLHGVITLREDKIHRIQNSFSWRVSTPIRALRRIICRSTGLKSRR